MATPSLQLEFTIHILDLSTPEHRRTSKTLLDSQHKPTVHQLDRSDLSHEELLDILNAFDDENTFEELDLASLETISGGLGLPEALISSTFLMVMLSSASGLFADSMGAVNNTKVQDALNAGIGANIEQVRNDLAGHLLQETGEFDTQGFCGALGQTFLDSDNHTTSGDDLLSLGGTDVTRSITANGNTITVNYSTSGSGTISTTTMVSPAGGWCA